MVGAARTHGARAPRGENGPGRGRRSTHRASSDAAGIGDALALLSTLVAAVTLLAKTLEKAIEPLADLAVVGKGMVAREGDAAGGGLRPLRGAGGLPPGCVPPAAAKAARCSPARRARNARRAKAFYSAKGERPAGDGEPAPARPAEGGTGSPPPLSLAPPPGEAAAASAASGEPTTTAAEAAAAPTTPISTAGEGEPAVRVRVRTRARARCAEQPGLSTAYLRSLPYPPCASPGRLCDHARARPMRANSLPTSIGPSWT